MADSPVVVIDTIKHMGCHLDLYETSREIGEEHIKETKRGWHLLSFEMFHL